MRVCNLVDNCESCITRLFICITLIICLLTNTTQYKHAILTVGYFISKQTFVIQCVVR